MMPVLKGRLLVGTIIGLLVGVALGYGSALSRVGSLEAQVSALQGQVASRDAQIESLVSQLEDLQYRNTLKVGKTGYPYSTIQGALNDAQPGDRVRVMDGAVYHESLKISKDNVTLDLRSATLRGTYVEENGILLNERSYVTIKNGVVQNFGGFTVALIRSHHITVENMRVQNNTGFGVFLWNSSHVTIRNSVITDNKNDGVMLGNGSSRNTISDNDLSRNNCGISAYHECNYNVVEGNYASNQKYEFGINIGHSSAFNRIVNNTANSNCWSGIALHDNSHNNTVENNVARYNRKVGIHLLFGASYNVIRNNTASSNGEAQISEDESCKGNALLDNVTVGPAREQQPSARVAQNDAGLGRDAASDDGKPDEIAPGRYAGYLDDADIYDYYTVYLRSGQTIRVEMTPPAGADFDLVLIDPKPDWVGRSLKAGSEAESLSYVVASPGYYLIVVRQWSGAGAYSIGLSVDGT